MAELTNCKVCGKNMSSEAEKCPHCGQPIESVIGKVTNKPSLNKKKWTKGKIIRLVILVLVLIFIIMMAIGMQQGSEKRERAQDIAVGYSSSEPTQTKEVTRDMYNQISDGMSINQVTSLIGEPDSSIDSESNGVKTVIYSYNKSMHDPVVTITFYNGRVYSKGWIDM